MKMHSFFKVSVVVFFSMLLPVSAYALSPAEVFEKVKDSVVVVKTMDSQGKVKGQGSGVLLPTGKIATNCHVVEGGTSYQVGRGKNFVPASLHAEDADKDICILDAKGITGAPVHLGNASSLKVGVPVYAVGAPYGLELSLSNGIVSQLRGGPPPLIQMTASISSGSSGGGLFDEQGRLVGLTTLYMEGGQNLNFAMPVEWISEVKPGIKPAKSSISQVEWMKRTTALIELENWQALLDWCQKRTESEPNNVFAWLWLGIAYINLNLYDDAIAAFNRAISLKSDFMAYYLRGFAYGKLGNYQQEINDYNKAIELNPQDADAYFGRGFAYANLGNNQQAIKDYNKAIELNPQYQKAYVNRGVAYGKRGNYQQAMKDYNKAIELNPQDAIAYFNRAVSYRNIGNNQQAIKDIKIAARLGYSPAQDFLRKMNIAW